MTRTVGSPAMKIGTPLTIVASMPSVVWCSRREPLGKSYLTLGWFLRPTQSMADEMSLGWPRQTLWPTGKGSDRGRLDAQPQVLKV